VARDDADAVTSGDVGDDPVVDTALDDVVDEELEAEQEPGVGTADDEPPGFWEQVGIDPIRIVVGDADLLTLRCYLDDRPVFLGSDGAVNTFSTTGALVRFVASGAEGNDMAEVSTWPDVVERAAARELEVEVDPLNVYVLPGLDGDIAQGPVAIDPTQLELATELLRDVGEWAGDDEPRQALAESESLGWLVSFVTRPDPTRMAPSPPFEADAARWRELVDDLEKRLVRR
jgi:hypothetical protein